MDHVGTEFPQCRDKTSTLRAEEAQGTIPGSGTTRNEDEAESPRGELQRPVDIGGG